MRIHQAVRVAMAPDASVAIYGRIWEFDGGIVFVRTPHGSTIRAGRLFVHPIVDEDGLARLRHYEELARLEGRDYDSSNYKV